MTLRPPPARPRPRLPWLRSQLAWPRARLAGVRLRSAVAAAAVVAAAVGLAGLGLVLVADSMLTGNVDAAATQRADQVAGMLTTGSAPALDRLLATGAADQSVVQLLDPNGVVVGASAELDGQGPITGLRPGPGLTERERHRLAGAADKFQVVAVGVSTPDGDRVVVVAHSLRSVDESLEFLSASVAIGLPILATVVGLATFTFVGRTLRPVEAIRRQVASISGHDLSARVPTPGTGDEVAKLAETMNAMLDRLESVTLAHRRFVADASHELRSPLATLRVGLDVLEADPQVPRDQLRRLFRETDRLSRLVTDLLLLARVEEHGLKARQSEVDLDDLAYRQQERLHAVRPELRVELDLTPVRILGDPHQLERAIVNLCDNAARHARGRVSLTVRGEAHCAVLVVADDGAGIGATDRERVFDRFVRLDDSRTRASGGTGLGLAITREIAHRHGGTVCAGAGDDGGARFELRLPRQPVDPEGGMPCESSSSRTRSSWPRRSAMA
jgi:signal transduction histidine kinase